MTNVTEQELIKKATAPRVTELDLMDNISNHYFFTGFDAIEGAELHRRMKSASERFDVGPWNKNTEEARIRNPLSVLTFCVIVLKNGYTVTGQSACADPTNYNEDIGNRLAFNDAKNKIWSLMGYSLKQEIYLNGDGTFKGRLNRETRELDDKLTKLRTFIQGDTFKTLTTKEQELLSEQAKPMQSYLEILVARSQ